MTWHVWFALAVIGWLWVSFVWAVIDTMRSGNSGIMHTMKLPSPQWFIARSHQQGNEAVPLLPIGDTRALRPRIYKATWRD